MAVLIILFVICSVIMSHVVARSKFGSYSSKEEEVRSNRADMYQVENDLDDGSFSCDVCFITAAGGERRCSFIPDDERPLMLSVKHISTKENIDFMCSRTPLQERTITNSGIIYQEIREGLINLEKYTYIVEGTRVISLHDHVINERLAITVAKDPPPPPTSSLPAQINTPTQEASAGKTEKKNVGLKPEQVRLLNALNRHVPKEQVAQMAVAAQAQRDEASRRRERKKQWSNTQDMWRQPPSHERGKSEGEEL